MASDTTKDIFERSWPNLTCSVCGLSSDTEIRHRMRAAVRHYTFANELTEDPRVAKGGVDGITNISLAAYDIADSDKGRSAFGMWGKDAKQGIGAY
jgi:hypothetical protein